jgi:hypothetical protein
MVVKGNIIRLIGTVLFWENSAQKLFHRLGHNVSLLLHDVCYTRTYVYEHFYVRSQNGEKRLFALSCLSVCPHGVTRLPLDGFGRNLIFRILFFFENMSTQFKFH